MNFPEEKLIGKYGLEIGGPSNMFRKEGLFPLYRLIDRLDGCNFSDYTIWEGDLTEGNNYQYEDEKTGKQYICDVVKLSSKIKSKTYDFVLSSNCIEHIANPLQAIQECQKVIKIGGVLLIIVPKKDRNFDHKRSVTLFSHIEEDYKYKVGEDNLFHLDEILKLHDLPMDPPAGNLKQFKDRSLQNYTNRALHHHVFDMDLLFKIYDFFKLKVLFTKDLGNDFLIIGEKI